MVGPYCICPYFVLLGLSINVHLPLIETVVVVFLVVVDVDIFVVVDVLEVGGCWSEVV